MRRIAFVCLKGGSSKTTTATCVGVALAGRGRRVLLVDVDQQANATWTMLGGRPAEPPTLAAVLTRQSGAEEAIRPSTVPGLDLLPASSQLGGVNVALAQELSRDTRLRSALAAIEGEYDYVLLDTGPSFTTLLANTLAYAREVIAPIDLGIYAVLGLVELQETIAEVREVYNPDLRLAGLVLTRVGRNNVARDVEKEVRDRFGELVFAATIPLSTKVEESHTRALTVMQYAPKSPAALAYGALVGEIEDGRAKERGRGGAVGGAGASPAA